MGTRRSTGDEIDRPRQPRTQASGVSQPLKLLETLRLLHSHITESLCNVVFGRVRRTERQRKWSLHALMTFWIEVIMRAPSSLTAVLKEKYGAAAQVQATPEAFFQRSQTLRPDFFAAVFREVVGSLFGEAPATYAGEMKTLQERFERIWIVDGSRLDKVLHRLKILWKDRRAVLPGCLLVFYDLFRGFPARLYFDGDAASPEIPRAQAALGDVPKGTLILGDRLYSGPAFFQALSDHGLHGLLRYSKHVLIKKVRCLARIDIEAGVIEDWEVRAGGGSTAPIQSLRWIVRRDRKNTFAVLTNIMAPAQLSATEALELYRHRWAVERLFFDLKTVLNLDRFYGANPNAVAMQVYACATVYVAMRIAQARLAHTLGRIPDEISTEKLFPRLAAASHGLLVFNETLDAVIRANPKTRLNLPKPDDQKWASTTWDEIALETRSPHRRQRFGVRRRQHWQSFKHVRGGRKYLT